MPVLSNFIKGTDDMQEALRIGYRAARRVVLVLAVFVAPQALVAQTPQPFPVTTAEKPPPVPGVAAAAFPQPNAAATAPRESLDSLLRRNPEYGDELESLIEDYLSRRESTRATATAEPPSSPANSVPTDAAATAPVTVCPECPDEYGLNLPILYDTLRPYPLPGSKPSKWYDKLAIRGYTQFRFDRTLHEDEGSAVPNLFGDRGINGSAENFLIRRLRLIFFGDISDHMSVYIQPDFASTPQGSTALTSFGQMRDAYADVYIDTSRVHRFRVGLSKVPYGWENMQSSQNRIPLDRTDSMNSAVAPNERDLGLFYYWTPEDKQQLYKALVDGGLKGSGNYGVFGAGVYNGQGGSIFELNDDLHSVVRFTWPMQLNWENGQVIEASLQGYHGNYVVTGAAISPLGTGAVITPARTGPNFSMRDQRLASTFVFFPQPFGFQVEWEVGEGPGLNDQQTAVVVRSLYGGYALLSYRHETENCGIFTPYFRYQQYRGGYRNIANAPFGNQRQADFGLEWQIRKEMELCLEYSLVNTPNFAASSTFGTKSYRDFEGSTLRMQFQVNY